MVRMGKHPFKRFIAATTWLTVAILALGGNLAYAAFSGTTSNGTNSFSSAADWTACTASTTVVAKTVGYVPGYIHQGGTLYLYANASDTGNPASGVGTITADVSSIDSGAGNTAVALVAGAYSVGGVSYGYRSASRTVKNPLAEGGYTYSLSCTDNASNSGTQSGFTVVVDNTAPYATDIQATNMAGGVLGKAEQGDTATFTFNEPMDPQSIYSGWTGGSTTVTPRFVNGSGSSNDSFSVYDSANVTQLGLFSVFMGAKDFVSANVNFTSSTMVMSGATITITLGTPSNSSYGSGEASAATMSWFPALACYDRAGNTITSSAGATESGALDKDF